MRSMDGEGGRERVSGVGSLLRACRLREGVTLVDAAEALNIRRFYLHAIEEERYGDLPVSPYAVGFVRCYAEYLGLDGAEVTRRFRAETAGSDGAAARRGGAKGGGSKRGADLRFPLAASETATPDGSVLLVGAMLALFAYGGWYAVTASDGLVSELVSPLPERLASLLPGAAELSPQLPSRLSPERSGEDPPPHTLAAGPGGESVEPPAAGPVVLDGQQPALAAGAPTAEATPDRVPELPPAGAHVSGSHVSGAPADHVGDTADRPRVSLEASEESWVEIRDRFDKRLVSRLMAPGDVLHIPDQAGLRMTVGNAGGLVIRVDGRSVPPLGGSGVVLRNVPLESASLQQANVSAN
jgi:cytoskeleton protein RodZ